jgi:hypothetical protein
MRERNLASRNDPHAAPPKSESQSRFTDEYASLPRPHRPMPEGKGVGRYESPEVFESLT